MLMYKLLIFLHKTEDDKALPHFREVILKHVSDLTGSEVKLAKVESNLLLDQKYSYFCEMIFESKEKMDEMLNSKSGKQLNKDLMNFHQLITIISVNYNYTE
jgi:uncharacterized protein (TIGR02118 family)